MNYKITVQQADKILGMIGIPDYTVVAIYEQSFRAVRINEYIVSEANIELMIEPELINLHNYWDMVSTVVHILRRFK